MLLTPFDAKLLLDTLEEALANQPDSAATELQADSQRLWRESAERIREELESFLNSSAVKAGHF